MIEIITNKAAIGNTNNPTNHFSNHGPESNVSAVTESKIIVKKTIQPYAAQSMQTIFQNKCSVEVGKIEFHPNT